MSSPQFFWRSTALILPELQSIIAEGEAYLWQEVLWHWRVGLLIFLGLTAIGGQIFSYLANSRRRSVTFFLNHLHSKAWGMRRGRDPNYRVAFFTPRRRLHLQAQVPFFGIKTVLKCYYRTDGRRPRKTWSTLPPPDPARIADGVVGCTWLHGFEPEVPALPNDPTEERIDEYCEQTYIGSDTYKNLSWRGAAMKATLVKSTAVEEPIGVLLIECKVPGSTIQMPQNFLYEAEVLGLIWRGLL